jgi:hypothetical protein
MHRNDTIIYYHDFPDLPTSLMEALLGAELLTYESEATSNSK